MTRMARRSLYRDLFFAHNGPGPYPCHFCGELVDLEDVTVHHVDDDHDNDAVANLTPAHGGCHTSHHSRQPHRLAQLAEAAKNAPGLSAKRSANMRRVNAALTSESRSAAARLRWARHRGEVA